MNDAPRPPQSERFQKWLGHNWLWFIPTAIVAVVGFWVVLFGAIFFWVFGIVRDSVPYKDAMASAQSDSRIIQHLGTPIEEGWLTSGSIRYNNASGDANLRIPLSGPKGSATLHLVAHRSAGRWTFSTLECQFENSREWFSVLPQTPP
jgi:hypothetical protein